MNTCYLMSVVTFLALVIGFLQSIFNFHVVAANHVTFMILTSILYAFTETLVIFFYVGTGVSIKEYTAEHKLDHSFHKRSIAVKRKVYPPLLLNMFFMVVLFVLVGAVDTHRIPRMAYQLFFLFCLIHYVKIKIVQNECFRDNTQIILEMSGLK